MNRIREIRERLRMSQAELSERTGISEGHLSKLENGGRRLNTDSMLKIATALDCGPEDLIAYAAFLPSHDDVEAAEFQGYPGLSDALASAGGTRVYKVIADSVEDAGVRPGMLIVVTESAEAVQRAKTGDIVLAVLGETTIRVLRQFVAPALLVTNRRGQNSVGRTDDRYAPLRIIGLVARMATT